MLKYANCQTKVRFLNISVQFCGVTSVAKEHYQLTALKHMYQLRGMASTLRMRHNQITQAVSAMDSYFALVGAHQHGTAVESMSGD